MEKKKIFPVVVLLPTNRMSGFVKGLPEKLKKADALVLGIRCREEALAFLEPTPKLLEYMDSFPKFAAVRYYVATENPEGNCGLCQINLQFDDEPDLCAVWCHCIRIVNGMERKDVERLNFAIFVDEDLNRVCFQAYTLSDDEYWRTMMSTFAAELAKDDEDWLVANISFSKCEFKSNF